MVEPSPEQNPQSVGFTLATQLIRELVLLRECFVALGERIDRLEDTIDEMNANHAVVSRTVEIMGESDHRPNWNEFLDAYGKAEAEIFNRGDGDGDEDDPDEDGGEPVPRDGRPSGSPRRRMFDNG